MKVVPATSASEIHRCSSTFQYALGCVILVRSCAGIAAIACRDRGIHPGRDREPGLGPDRCGDDVLAVLAGVGRTNTRPVTPAVRAVLTASTIRRSAPWPDTALPLHSRATAMTGAHVGDDRVAICALRPLTLESP